MSGLSTVTPRGRTFRHEALLYAGQAQFLDGVLPFIREGLAEGQAQLVATDRAKIELVRGALGEASNHVEFADMAELGANPARIIPAWREFADRNGRRPLRGIGEPIWAGRTPAELIECQRHEALLNLAFAGAPPWRGAWSRGSTRPTAPRSSRSA